MRATTPLLLLVAAKLTLSALYVPAYEGPDEPFHLAHVFEPWNGATVPSSIAGSVKGHPCAADLQRALGCPPFGPQDAAFNVLRTSNAVPARSIVNYEAHQPPLYYVVGNAVVAAMPSDPVLKLLAMRFFSVTLVIAAIVILLRPLRDATWLDAVLLAVLVPGAAEALARCANDAAVFAWCAAVMWAIARKAPTPALAVLAFLGPIIKLTAIAIVAYVVAWAWTHRSRMHAIAIAAASALYLPLQALRGYAWGGTVELNVSPLPYHETRGQAVVGFARSAYTFAKTAFWLGEWSFFRAPLWLLVLVLIYVGVFLACARLNKNGSKGPHFVTLAVATIATSAFFISHRIVWGQWGGVGGWYAWGWFPWLAVAIAESFEVRSKRMLFAGGAVIVALANAAWFASAHAIYA